MDSDEFAACPAAVGGHDVLRSHAERDVGAEIANRRHYASLVLFKIGEFMLGTDGSWPRSLGMVRQECVQANLRKVREAARAGTRISLPVGAAAPGVHLADLPAMQGRGPGE